LTGCTFLLDEVGEGRHLLRHVLCSSGFVVDYVIRFSVGIGLGGFG
jgi:hypothetical protein